MPLIDEINRVIVSLGVPSIVGLGLYVGRKLQVLDTLDRTIKNEIKPDLKDVRERFAALEGRMAGYTQSRSPISLTEKGQKLLNESGLKEYIDKNKDRLLRACESKFKMETAYDVQEAVFDYFDNQLELDPEYEKRIKEYAYKDGAGMEIVRRVGAIYFRDICLKHFNKDATELDKHPVPVSTSPN